jgi:ABC-type branched-subunit amino acid transport system ATPase component
VAETGKTILEIQDLSKSFGGIRAVDELSFDVKRGEILGLIGPNGSGKTTLFNLITGVYEADSGRIRFQTQDITNELSYRIALKGISRTFQSTKVFHTQTVLDNIATAMIARARKRHISETRQKVSDILDFTRLEKAKTAIAGDLTHAEQRRLMVAMALVEDPDLLLLDEITAGMSGEECNEMIEMTKRIRDKGTTIVLIEHNMRVAMALSDRIVVLNFGRKIAEGKPEEITTNETVLEAYLGREEA